MRATKTSSAAGRFCAGQDQNQSSWRRNRLRCYSILCAMVTGRAGEERQPSLGSGGGVIMVGRFPVFLPKRVARSNSQVQLRSGRLCPDKQGRYTTCDDRVALEKMCDARVSNARPASVCLEAVW